jgi:hypothetical protein
MRKFNSVKELLDDMDKKRTLWDKIILHPSMEWLRWIIYNSKDVPNDLYRKCKRGWQRAYRGWADDDTWNLDGYLSKIIRDSVKGLRNTNDSYPADMKFEEWEAILDNIVYTFDINYKVLNNYYLILQKVDKWSEELYLEQKEKYYEFHVLSLNETIRYERGWQLFKTYYFQLWN